MTKKALIIYLNMEKPDNKQEQKERYRPKLELAVDKEYDKRVGVGFLSEGETSPHPDLARLLGETDRDKIRREVFAYVEKAYEADSDKIERGFREAVDGWAGVEDYFYEKADEIFKGYPWPKGDYTGYGSIWNIYPREIEEKEFTFPLETRAFPKWAPIDAKSTIAHEMLHFITYDYLEKKHGLTPSECYDEDNIFWQFTENLNCLIENDRMWEPLKGKLPVPPKEECRELYGRMKEVWDKNRDIDDLVEIFLKKKDEQ
ncbi:hypothetical protein A2303_03310 [Candidatus Falkowbacteria bacterium RIFOXYB2_FULL_47_14]|uniref:Uncharacterized protein n=1 Tax=Candidatus Falkowbacteria bacterium RIFOXYA2_FULL_47_19 TaxID=1797994 RepID=A0A1F5SKB6_9BACT|nr:MAG: hypothetical protein A2227_04405 [Candidatus Falkowbacteria bacterium RIFOXYA2_FULL_47_19]OGF37001.1 MAG: hypothetical protein A2468_01345 [Candidatus Falkowbacteria bacterium RIFOXYC2_FULL_46_15]OGF44036.1 MAG: hypothetical protein A2303_03310 [Candidatus Falkowbacteria bacterium RIFOXYB2_FULL_47_14]